MAAMIVVAAVAMVIVTMVVIAVSAIVVVPMSVTGMAVIRAVVIGSATPALVSPVIKIVMAVPVVIVLLRPEKHGAQQQGRP